MATITDTIPASESETPRPSHRFAWDAAMAWHLEAKAAYQRFDKEVWDPAYEREKAFERRHGLPENATHAQRQAFWKRFGEDCKVPDSIHDEGERLSTESSESEDALMAMPSPDLAALRWKLDKVLEPEDDGSTPAWSKWFVRQTVDDYRRLLATA